MTQAQINSLLNSFFISDEELESRAIFNEFVYSISSIVVDEFAKNYLLNNPYLSVYLAHTDGSMLLKKIKTFVAFILTAPVDEEYVHKIHSIGSVHYAIKLEPAKVSYGFWAVGEVLNKLADTNPLVKEHKPFISKLLKFVEHLMNDGYYLQRDLQTRKPSDEFSSSNIQNRLYTALNIHKLNAQKVKKSLTDPHGITLLSEIKNDPNLCEFGKLLKTINKNDDSKHLLGNSYEKIDSIHKQWHEDVVAIKTALEANNIELANTHNTNITKLTDELLTLLDTNLKATIESGEIALSSGIEAMKKITKLFYNKDHKNVKDFSPLEIITQAIDKAVVSEFIWGIEDFAIDVKNIQTKKQHQISKTIRYNGINVFIHLSLKPEHYTSYLDEMIHLLLEVLELHFFVQERELSLIHFADEAENANRSKDMFLANMSHELRTPINAITGFSQILMMKKETPPNLKTYIEKINIAGNNLLTLVNTILDFAKLESGKMQFNPSLSNISKLLNETKILVTPLAEKKNIILQMPNIISLNLYIDNTLFKQVLINLLSNAIKFTHEGGEVTLNLSYNEAHHTYVFEVKDNGVGLSKEEMSKLFIAFSQIENSYQKEHKGTGLGLMISKNIVEDLHKGKIWVESQKGKGSSFFIEMPTPMLESNTYTVEIAPKTSQRVLIVEDSPEYQKILIANLQETHRLTITDTVNKAKELILKNSYDFLILDFFLTDGISSEILQFMEIEHISIPAIVVSAEDEIHISSSLAGSSNLECIINKTNVNQICASIRGEVFK